MVTNLNTHDSNKMEDSLPLKLALPGLKYPTGSEPKERLSINQHSNNKMKILVLISL